MFSLSALNTIDGQTEVRLELYTEFTGTKLGSGTVHSSGTLYRWINGQNFYSCILSTKETRRSAGTVKTFLLSLYKKVRNLIYPQVLWFKVFRSISCWCLLSITMLSVSSVYKCITKLYHVCPAELFWIIWSEKCKFEGRSFSFTHHSFFFWYHWAKAFIVNSM